METTDIYDILIKLVDDFDETLLDILDVTDYVTAYDKLILLDAGQVRYVYETYQECQFWADPEK
jgi:hypothetical protein